MNSEKIKKYSILYEIPILFGILYGMNWLFIPEAPAFIGISPHPYWIAILIFGFRYGIFAGLVSGLLAAGLYLLIAWNYVERYVFEDITFYLLPIFFITVGSLIGVGVYRYKRSISLLVENKLRMEENEAVYQEEIDVLKRITKEMEKKIVSRMTTLVTVYEGARRLETAHVSELYKAIVNFIAKTLHCEEVSIFLKTDSDWTLEESYGWKEYQNRPTHYSHNEGIVGQAGTKNKIVSIKDFFKSDEVNEQSSMLGDCLMAGPLRLGEYGEVIGVFAIQKMPFTEFNNTTISLFNFLLNWASRSLGRAYYIEGLQSGEILDPQLNIYSTTYFQSRLSQEFERSRMYYLPLSLALIKLEGLNTIDEHRKEKIIVLVSEILKSSVREMDVVARFKESSVPFAILMITASDTQMNGIISKIQEQVAALAGHADSVFSDEIKLKIGKSQFSPKILSENEMVDLALKDCS